ncbi:MAG: hypothetical protein ABWW69_03335, partial [Pyrodictiaceae archaeon]
NCNKRYILLFSDAHGIVYKPYSFDTDPQHPCLSGSIIDPRMLLNSTGCIVDLIDRIVSKKVDNIIAKNSSLGATKRVLSLVYEPSLSTIVWLGRVLYDPQNDDPWQRINSILERGLIVGSNFEPLIRAYVAYTNVSLSQTSTCACSGQANSWFEVYSYYAGPYIIGDDDRIFYRLRAYHVSGWVFQVDTGRTYINLVAPPMALVTGDGYNPTTDRWRVATVAQLQIPLLVERGVKASLRIGLIPRVVNNTGYYTGLIYKCHVWKLSKGLVPWGCQFLGVCCNATKLYGVWPHQYARVSIGVLETSQYTADTIVAGSSPGPGTYHDILRGIEQQYEAVVPLYTQLVYHGPLDKPLDLNVTIDSARLFKKAGVASRLAIVVVTVTIVSGPQVSYFEVRDDGLVYPKNRVWAFLTDGVDTLVYAYLGLQAQQASNNKTIMLAPPGIAAGSKATLIQEGYRYHKEEMRFTGQRSGDWYYFKKHVITLVSTPLPSTCLTALGLKEPVVVNAESKTITIGGMSEGLDAIKVEARDLITAVSEGKTQVLVLIKPE